MSWTRALAYGTALSIPAMGFLAYAIVQTDMQSNAASHSFGDENTRVLADPSIEAFDAVGVISNGRGLCTGTKIDWNDFSPVDGGNVILTAMHCLPSNPNGPITFSGTFTNASGQEEAYNVRVTEVWEHPFYSDYRDIANVDRKIYTPYDVALLYIPAGTNLDDVPAANFHPYNFSQNHIQNGVGSDLSAIGSPREHGRPYWDPECRIRGIEYQDITSDCDIIEGDSGGPVTALFNQSYDTLDVYFVNGGVTKGTDFALHSYLDERFMNTVEFVVAHKDNRLTCAVSNEQQRRYMGPGDDFQALRSRESFNAVAPLFENHGVVTYGDVQVGRESWTLTGAIDSVGATEFRFGYVPTRSLTPVSCS